MFSYLKHRFMFVFVLIEQYSLHCSILNCIMTVKLDHGLLDTAYSALVFRIHTTDQHHLLNVYEGHYYSLNV